MRPFVEALWPLAALQVQPDRAKLRALQPLVQDGIDNLEPDLGCLDVAREGRGDGRSQAVGLLLVLGLLQYAHETQEQQVSAARPVADPHGAMGATPPPVKRKPVLDCRA